MQNGLVPAGRLRDGLRVHTDQHLAGPVHRGRLSLLRSLLPGQVSRVRLGAGHSGESALDTGLPVEGDGGRQLDNPLHGGLAQQTSRGCVLCLCMSLGGLPVSPVCDCDVQLYDLADGVQQAEHRGGRHGTAVCRDREDQNQGGRRR